VAAAVGGQLHDPSYELGANSYLTKPVDFGRYMEVVSSAGAYWGRFNVLPSALR
jgi:hypothetical protein